MRIKPRIDQHHSLASLIGEPSGVLGVAGIEVGNGVRGPDAVAFEELQDIFAVCEALHAQILQEPADTCHPPGPTDAGIHSTARPKVLRGLYDIE